MRIEGRTERLDVEAADLTGSVFRDVVLREVRLADANLSALSVVNADARGACFEDVNLGGARFSNISFAGAAIEDFCLEGLTIDGVLVTELFKAYRAAHVALEYEAANAAGGR